MDIYERIYNLLKERNMTGKDLAPILGLKKSPLTDWKNKKSQPTLDQITIICEFFATSADYIIFGKKDPLPFSNSTSSDEIELVENYRKLDSRGKHKLHTVIYEELDRMDAAPPSSAEKVS